MTKLRLALWIDANHRATEGVSDLPDPFNLASSERAGQNPQDVLAPEITPPEIKGAQFFLEKESEPPGHSSTLNVLIGPGAVLPEVCGDFALTLPPSEGTYFEMVPTLNALREQARKQVGASAYDLIRSLDQLANQAFFDPVGAVQQGKTSDDYFKDDPTFYQLETELADRISPDNVSEVFALIKDAESYTPSRRVVAVLELVYRYMLSDAPPDAESGCA